MEAEIIYEPEHYSVVCGCTIPASWTAFIFSEDGDALPKFPCGDTRDEAVKNVRREFPGVRIVGEEVSP